MKSNQKPLPSQTVQSRVQPAAKHGALRKTLRGMRPFALGGVAVCVVMGMLLFSVGGVQGFWAYRSLQHKKNALQQEVEMLKQQKRDMLWQIGALNNNPGYLQHLVRERLGWVERDEYLLLVPSTQNPPKGTTR